MYGSGIQDGSKEALIMNILTKEAMEKLPTPRLLAYRKKLRKRKYVGDDASSLKEQAMKDSKEILDTREDV